MNFSIGFTFTHADKMPKRPNYDRGTPQEAMLNITFLFDVFEPKLEKQSISPDYVCIIMHSQQQHKIIKSGLELTQTENL